MDVAETECLEGGDGHIESAILDEDTSDSLNDVPMG